MEIRRYKQAVMIVINGNRPHNIRVSAVQDADKLVDGAILLCKTARDDASDHNR